MPSITAEDLPEEHDVAVVVIVRARGVDASDAADRAVYAIRRELRAAAPIALPHQGEDVEGATVELYKVLEAGSALANGYLWASPTTKARRERPVT